jgi:uncharacterized membrane protein YdjX (TVP38/TMEM64 family)
LLSKRANILNNGRAEAIYAKQQSAGLPGHGAIIVPLPSRALPLRHKSASCMAGVFAFFKKYWAFLVSLGLIATGVAAYFSIEGFRLFLTEMWQVIWSGDEQAIMEHFRAYGIWGPLLIILLMALQMFLIVFPTWLPMIVAILGYGPWWGSLISVAAVLTASTIGYFIGQALGDRAKGKFIGEENYKKLHQFMQRYGFGAVVLFRISPFLSNDAISFVAGMIRMGYWRYMAATLAGIGPLVAAIAYFGRDTQTLKQGLYWIGAAGVAVYLLYIWLDKRKRQSQ